MRPIVIIANAIVFLFAASFAPFGFGQTIYKCETEEGITFSSQPCDEAASKIRPNEGMSGGVDYFEGEEEVDQSEAPSHDGPVLKSLSGQVRDNKKLLYDYILTKKSPQRNCGSWIDKNGMEVYIACNK